jgi:hypothetical protein
VSLKLIHHSDKRSAALWTSPLIRGIEDELDTVLVLRYVPQNAPAQIRFVSSLYDKARTLADVRYHRPCNILATEGSRFGKRASSWYHASDMFRNKDVLASYARFAIVYQGELLMAKNTSKTQDFKRDTWKGFLEYRLSDAELLAADEWELSDVNLVIGVMSLIENGYKFTASYKAETGVATCTLQASEALPKLSGWALSTKGANAREAIKLMLYKHFTALEEDWTPLLGADKPVQRG